MPGFQKREPMILEIFKKEAVSDLHTTSLLFVHGMWHAAWCWEEHFLPFFAQHGYTSYALSLRGHGGSEGREQLRWTSLADYVSDVMHVVDQMDSPPVLVGHSMGGMIVQKYLESNGAPAAVLLASAPPKGVFAATLRIAMRHPLTFLKANLTMSMYQVVKTPQLAREAFFSAGVSDKQVRDFHSRLQDESYRVYLDMMGLNLPQTKKVKTPMLVLGAVDDGIITTREVEMTARAYDTRAEVFPNIAHDMMLEERWQTVAERMLNWLNEQGL
jgi:alpha-beta hydrolase superfamily lysophospholipase